MKTSKGVIFPKEFLEMHAKANLFYEQPFSAARCRAWFAMITDARPAAPRGGRCRVWERSKSIPELTQYILSCAPTPGESLGSRADSQHLWRELLPPCRLLTLREMFWVRAPRHPIVLSRPTGAGWFSRAPKPHPYRSFSCVAGQSSQCVPLRQPLSASGTGR